MPTPDFDWAATGAPARLLSVLNDAGEARFVGGCVRDSLLGRPPGPEGRTDIDIATTLLPDEVMAVLDAAEIRHIPTGVEHGTITAVIDHVPYEITTLRADVETDGRRAVVAFTDDWSEDASRRDFTINALYLGADGHITDFFGGQGDLAGKRVRFIGAPEDRIREDYLRILRFLRFSARYAEAFDADGWAACKVLADGLGHLSKERIWSETAKLFAAPLAPMALGEAAAADVLARICPSAADAGLFARVHGATVGDVGPALGLAALWPAADRATLKSAFKPATSILDDVTALHAAAQAMGEGRAAREILYRHGREIGVLAACLAVGRGAGLSRTYADDLAKQPVPILPLKGADFVARGVPKGPKVGASQKHFETAWIDAGFPEDAATIDRLATAAIGAV